MTSLQSLTSFMRRFHAVVGRRLAVSLLLMIALSCLEGIGILLLLPLLSFVGVGATGNQGSRLAAVLHQAFDTLHLPATLEVVLLLFAALFTLRRVVVYANEVLNVQLQQDFMERLRRDLYDALLHGSWPFFLTRKSADFLQALTTDMNRIGHGSAYLQRTLVTTLLIGGYLLLALLIDPGLTLVTAGIGGGVLWLLRKRLRNAALDGREITQITNGLFRAITEHLSGMKETKSFAAEGRNLEQFQTLNETNKALIMRFNRGAIAAQMWFSLASTAVFCLFFYAAVTWFALPGPSLLLLILIFARLMPQVAALQQNLHHLNHVLPVFQNYRELLAACREAREFTADQNDGVPPLSESLRLAGVSYAYAQRAQPALQQLDLDFAANQTTALVGASGAGKTTVADLLMGLISPQSGNFQVNGVPLSAQNLVAWRQQVAYVPQETFLFDGTIADNLRWAVVDADEAAMWRALERAAAADFVRALPQGLAQPIGERGVQLSGGEKQRIALARALLREPRLLILDEATSALDSDNESRIQQALDQLHGDLTIVLIAHRLYSLKRADQIKVLENGRLVQSGTWSQLATSDGPFQTMLARQNGGHQRDPAQQAVANSGCP